MNPAAAQFEEAPRILFFDTGFFRTLIKGYFHQQMANLESELQLNGEFTASIPKETLYTASISLLKHQLSHISERNHHELLLAITDRGI